MVGEFWEWGIPDEGSGSEVNKCDGLLLSSL